MNVNQSIAKRAYLATDEQIRALALANYEGGEAVSATGSTFLRVELAAVLQALGLEPRMRAGGRPANAPDRDAVLVALRDVHTRLYGLVLEAITTDDIADKPGLRKPEKSRRALERNRRSNFARSAKSTLSAFIRAGGNVAALVVSNVTKASLRAEVDKHKPKLSADQQAEQIAARMAGQIARIREDNAELAQQIAQKLTLQLADVTCDKFTTSPAKSVKEGIPLRLDVHGENEIFLPVAQVVGSDVQAANEDRAH